MFAEKMSDSMTHHSYSNLCSGIYTDTYIIVGVLNNKIDDRCIIIYNLH